MSSQAKQRKLGRALLALLLAALLFVLTAAGSTSSRQVRFCSGSSAERAKAGVVGPPIQGVSVALQTKRFEPGEDLYARLLNRGEGRAKYGPQHRIERYINSRWTVDPAGPHGPWHKVFWLLPSNTAGRCFHYTIPIDQPTGVYRFVVPVTTNLGRSGRTAVFRVE